MNSEAHRGFTLIELLIALAIFALMSAAAYRALDGLMSSQFAVEQATAKVQVLNAALNRIERDVQVALPRSRISESGVREPAFYAPQNSAIIAWTRAGFAGGDVSMSGAASNATGLNNAIAHSTPQRVGYRLRNGIFEFLLWPRLDAAPRLEPEVSALLTDVERVNWRFLGASNNNAGSNWVEQWPPTASAQTELPRAVEVTITFTNGERLLRLIPVVARAS